MQYHDISLRFSTNHALALMSVLKWHLQWTLTPSTLDLWFELTEHLSADTIPNPLDFYKEREAVIRYVDILVFTMRPD